MPKTYNTEFALYLPVLCESFTIGCSDTLHTLHYDHLPICCTCNLPITETHNVYRSTYIKCTVKVRWDKTDLLSYFNITGSLRHDISVPVFSCPIACNCISQHDKSIATSLCRASLLNFPRIPFNYLNSFWSDDLDRS